MSKRRGTLWIVIGLLLLLGAAGLTVYNMHEEKNAGEESEAVVEELSVALTDAIEHTEVIKSPVTEPVAVSEPEPEPIELDGRYYMGLISFPSLNLQLPVQHEWSYENLKISPCRMKGSPATEDLVILAHNYRTHFGPLNRLSVGDEVSVMLLDGTVYVYKVSAREVVAPTAVENVTNGDWPLTLFTCTLGGRTRLVIRCDWAE